MLLSYINNKLVLPVAGKQTNSYFSHLIAIQKSLKRLALGRQCNLVVACPRAEVPRP